MGILSSMIVGIESEESYMGSYYVLEVGNFDDHLPPQDTGTEQGQAKQALDSQSSGVVAIPVPGELDGGYFLLNTDDPTLYTTDENGATYSSVPTRQNNSYYENTKPGAVSLIPQNAEVIEPPNWSVGGVNSKLHPHLIIADEEELERACQAGIQSEGRASTYENVSPPEQTFYENIDLKLHPPSSSNSNHAPCSSAGLERPGVRRSVQQRKDVYEVVPIGGRKVNGARPKRNHGSHHSPENGMLWVLVL